MGATRELREGGMGAARELRAGGVRAGCCGVGAALELCEWYEGCTWGKG